MGNVWWLSKLERMERLIILCRMERGSDAGKRKKVSPLPLSSFSGSGLMGMWILPLWNEMGKRCEAMWRQFVIQSSVMSGVGRRRRRTKQWLKYGRIKDTGSGLRYIILLEDKSHHRRISEAESACGTLPVISLNSQTSVATIINHLKMFCVA